ncbi:flagellar basal body L-ring protein FlgH [Opitutus sp. ER46]|uniref:flagellar basal body L-ring protein FlgH n=1 Tax=Opitutus sp. ER46 TaxID=2161864 RepID=UPI001E564578|nr:flagellar basal body L-ring protein FlgH [Opitutus sp. ER46]
MSKSASSLRRSSAVLALLATAVAVQADSIWPASGRVPAAMFADRKASAPGDILTIIVAESVAAQNSQSKKSERKSSLEDAVSKFIFSGVGSHASEMPGLSVGGSSSYSGGGDVSNTQSLSSRAAVLVTDVLPNGNLVIEGVRVVRSSGETQYVVLHGLVRPEDISRTNTLVSSNIADARVEFYSEGALTEAQKRGWLTKIYEKLRPF